jgi:hypothetical protein
MTVVRKTTSNKKRTKTVMMAAGSSKVKRPKFQRRHFVAKANEIKTMPSEPRLAMAKRWLEIYASDNPQFDKTKFLVACGVL